jgi:predicted O-methyltransferase YrrM
VPPEFEPRLAKLLGRLHQESAGQEAEITAYFTKRAQEGTLDFSALDAESHAFMRDKLVALEPDKAELCYRLCRALRATRVVEAGTSYGVSTLYLAEAVRQNGGGLVIATEYEPAKALRARAHFAEAGLSEQIELREGDLRQTLSDLRGPIDFALIDIWDVALDALERISPHLRPGAVVITDNTARHRDSYAAYFEFVHDPANRFTTQTLPFDGGLELTVRI